MTYNHFYRPVFPFRKSSVSWRVCTFAIPHSLPPGHRRPNPPRSSLGPVFPPPPPLISVIWLRNFPDCRECRHRNFANQTTWPRLCGSVKHWNLRALLFFNLDSVSGYFDSSSFKASFHWSDSEQCNQFVISQAT